MLANSRDKPLLSDRTQTADRLKIEQRFKLILPREILASLKSADIKVLPKIIKRVVANNCWALWLAGMMHGQDHGYRELKLLGHHTAKFALVDEDPPSRIQNKRAQDAIWERVNTLAGNVADTEWAKIQAALEENVRGDSSRSDLQSAINDTLGSKTFAGRAETIARTELAHAYNTGRIKTFVDNGVEAVRRYCIIDERTCPQCAGLNGMVANLNDWGEMAKIYAPSHPRCRCTISPLLDIRQLAEANRKPPPIVQEPWMVERIVKGIIGG